MIGEFEPGTQLLCMFSPLYCQNCDNIFIVPFGLDIGYPFDKPQCYFCQAYCFCDIDFAPLLKQNYFLPRDKKIVVN